MFSKSFFKFLIGFVAIIGFGVFGALFSSRYFSMHQDMFASTEDA